MVGIAKQAKRMRKADRKWWKLCAVGVLCAMLSVARGQEGMDLRLLQDKVQKVAQKVLPATVALVSEESGASGSGVIVDEAGLILTAAHVVQGAREMMVMFPDGKQETGKVLGANYTNDIAMVRIAGEGKWPHVELGSSNGFETGDWVVATGHSAGFDAKRTPPVRFGRVITPGPGFFLTTDCTLIGGDSGGPLFDLDGRLVAIHSSIGESLANNNHAGVDGFKKHWKRLLAGEKWGRLTMNPFDNPDTPVLGIDMMVGGGISGVVVGGVYPDSPAQKAGMKTGDVIVKCGGEEIAGGDDLQFMLAKHSVGETVGVDVIRGNERKMMNVELVARGDFFK